MGSDSVLAKRPPETHSQMIATRISDEIGIGIYSPSQAAFYARVRMRTLNRWVFGDARSNAVVSAQMAGRSDEKVVTVRNFVQALGICTIRIQYPKISLQKIRKAIDLAKNQFDVPYPFARPHRSFIYQERELVLEVNGNLVQLSGKHSKNIMLGPIAERYLDRLEFGDDGLAVGYRAWEGNGRQILMNPKRRFGEPIVKSCGYTAETLWDVSIAEGGIGAAARAYGVDCEDVTLACDYYDHLLSVAA